ncbi:Tyrosine-protein kinase EpsD [Minicystis rosea]|nr:Tyrosine-protein kinase EpsD [Minicystis rosea]
MDSAREAETTSPYAALEGTLDRSIGLLTRAEGREARALLIEARRLRSVVANWCSIPPSPEVREEMLERVSQLSMTVDAIARQQAEGPAISVHVASGPLSDITASLDFEPRLYSFESTTAAPRSVSPTARSVRPLSGGARSGPLDFEPQAARFAAAAPQAALMAPRGATALDETDTPPRAIRPAPSEPTGSRSAAPILRETPTLRERSRSSSPVDVEGTTESPAITRRTTTTPASQVMSPAPREAVKVEEIGALGAARITVTAEPVPLAEPLHPALLFATDPYSPRADAYRALRRKLAAAGNPRIIGVTSAHPGEGKTTFALNIGLALRESAVSRVLVIEANHRAPSFHKMLGLTPPKCFLEQCAAHVDDVQAPWLAIEPMAKLHVMAIDPRVRHEPLIDPVAFAAGMRLLKDAGYDHIVIDCPPVLGSVDCNVITDSIDGMVLTSLTMKSKRREMRKAVEQLDPAPIFGVVVLEAY